MQVREHCITLISYHHYHVRKVACVYKELVLMFKTQYHVFQANSWCISLTDVKTAISLRHHITTASLTTGCRLTASRIWRWTSLWRMSCRYLCFHCGGSSDPVGQCCLFFVHCESFLHSLLSQLFFPLFRFWRQRIRPRLWTWKSTACTLLSTSSLRWVGLYPEP